MRRVKSEVVDGSSIDLTIISSDSDYPTTSQILPKKRKRTKKAAEVCNTIKVTEQERVLHVKHIEGTPSVWDVPREATAYVLDCTGDIRTLEKRSGDTHSLQSFICHEVRTPVSGTPGMTLNSS